MTYFFEVGEEFARKLDEQDPLKSLRGRFHVPDGTIYMDGNSLGLLPRGAEVSLLRVLDEWKTMAINGWLDAKKPWFSYAEELGKMAAPLVGARSDEVVLSASTTGNLHSLVSTFYRSEGKRTKILADELTFPSDLYALASEIRLKGLNPEENLLLAGSRDGRFLEEEDIMGLMDDTVSVAVLPSVLYRSGQLLDMERLTRHAHSKGIIIGFDCAHSVGAVPHCFDEWGVDFAFWCSYKYMNGGPGSPAFLYLNERHFDLEPGMAGWFGYAKERQFDMAREFEHARSAGGWQMGTPSLLSAAPLEGSLEIFAEVGIEALRKKSLRMTSYLIYLVDELLSGNPYGFSIGSPRDESRRGGHVAIEHQTEAVRLCSALRARGVVPDFRPPNIIRTAPMALYNSYHEVWQVVNHLKQIVDGREYERFSKERGAVS
jgi:kynureninase